MNLCVIPARGGSQRIPRKNIREFAGKPMIAHSILAARDSGLFSHILVSTDDTEIAKIASEWGADVPFMRPPQLADDHAGITAVMAHATQWTLDKGWDVDAVCCLLATAPFVGGDDLRRGLRALDSGEWYYAFSVSKFVAPIFRAFKLHPNGGIEMFFPQHFTTRSQDLPVAFHDAGQFYWGRPKAWIEHKVIFDRHSYPVVIPRWRVQDIDTEEDWRHAALMHDVVSKRRA